MGKKSRRKREKTLNFLRQNAAETVDVVEEEDPSYKTIAMRPKEIAQLTLKHRFGGAHITRGNLRSVGPASDPTGSGSGDACAIIVQRVPTLPSLVSWCAVDVVWHDTVPKSASASTGPVTSRIA